MDTWGGGIFGRDAPIYNYIDSYIQGVPLLWDTVKTCRPFLWDTLYITHPFLWDTLYITHPYLWDTLYTTLPFVWNTLYIYNSPIIMGYCI